MEASNWITLIIGLGVGSGLTALVQHFLKKQEAVFTSQRQDLEKRYRVIILLMYAAYDFEGNSSSLRINRSDLKSQGEVLEELKAEWFNMLLFASEATQKSLHSFIQKPTLENLKNTALSMRKDLGRGGIGNLIYDLTFKP
ncbi:hypothetical protein P886_1996 [Alteromonadaceae bacterium 2753L.S.0a.02]|nr:hypothetical protein P886_1996 [Alteromonadaceae bacterium 2753L.S.0a.02]